MKLISITFQLLKRHYTSLPSADKAVQVTSEADVEAAEESHSINGSFISDTLTLNGVKCDMKGLVKYSRGEAKMAAVAAEKREGDSDLEDDKTEADLTEDEYTYDANPGEIFSKFVPGVVSKSRTDRDR